MTAPMLTLVLSNAPVTSVNVTGDTTAEGYSFFSGTVTSNYVLLSVSGGVPPYTYSWARVSGATGFTVEPDATTLNVRWSKVLFNVTETAVWRLTVTDSATNTDTHDVTVSLTSEIIEPGGGL